MREYEKNENDDMRIGNRFNMLHNQASDAYKERRNSFKTEANYQQGVDSFCNYLAANTGINKLENGFKPKHILGFAEDMQERGLSASTQKTYMSALRDFADRNDIDQRNIPNNDRLGLNRRSGRNVDRSWSKEEFQEFQNRADEYDKQHDNGGKMRLILDTGMEFGCRLKGILNMDTKAIDEALEKGELNTKEKAGKINTKPVETLQQRELLERIKAFAEETGNKKVFVNNDYKTTYKEVQNFIGNNRDKIQDQERLNTIDARDKAQETGQVQASNLNYHGLRYSYARNQFEDALDRGMTQEKALEYVSKLLGHNRPEITKTYLAKAGMAI